MAGESNHGKSYQHLRVAMRIASLLVRTGNMIEAEQAVSAIPGVEIHARDEKSGTLLVTVEDGEGYAVADSLSAISLAKPVLCATLIYEHTEELPEPMGA
ncbi:chaperone NapD [Corticimicrobacter populi]|uniref:Nitrate reductase n=1 Tax=Corticimicrobacter populi TaxID=2175229 RepID=A0A2V1JTQ1_9BURK|nr:chaperone NapD [Corticimicrobacter populi]PWF21256.1 nitrate reductase [Corticimicrobacter populi]